jgi:hypothetical protein
MITNSHHRNLGSDNEKFAYRTWTLYTGIFKFKWTALYHRNSEKYWTNLAPPLRLTQDYPVHSKRKLLLQVLHPLYTRTGTTLIRPKTKDSAEKRGSLCFIGKSYCQLLITSKEGKCKCKWKRHPPYLKELAGGPQTKLSWNELFTSSALIWK